MNDKQKERKPKKSEAELYGLEPPESVSYFEHVCEVNHLREQCTRWTIAALIIFIALIVTNVGWLLYEAQFVDEVTETVETSADGGGNAYGTLITGNNSEVNYGEGEGNSNENAQEENGR